MRIALLTNFIPPYRVRLFEALAQQAGALRVLVSTRMESNRQWQPEWGTLDVVEQRTITLRRTWRTQTFREPYELHIPYDTTAQLRRWRPDIILSGEFGARSVLATLYGRATHTPIVLWAMLSEHTESSRGRLRDAVRRRLIGNAHSVIVNGASGARYIERMGMRADRIVRVPQSLDMTTFLALPLERPAHDELRLLHVGSLSERKGIRSLLAGVRQCAQAHADRRIRLTMVGTGPLADELRAQTRARIPNLAIVWAGSVPYEALPAWYADADVLVFPSLADEWGLVVNEAFAAGVPVMGSIYAQAVTELIEDHVNGWSFTPDSDEAVRQALDRVLDTSAGELAAMRRAARERIRALTPEAAAERITEHLRAVRAVPGAP